MTDYTALIARLEAATESTIELREMIAEALGWRSQRVVSVGFFQWCAPRSREWHMSVPDWTGSLDAAVSLLPEGCDWGCEPRKQGTYFAEVKCPQWTTCGKSDHSRVLALLIAIFRARQSIEAAGAARNLV